MAVTSDYFLHRAKRLLLVIFKKFGVFTKSYCCSERISETLKDSSNHLDERTFCLMHTASILYTPSLPCHLLE